MTEHEPKPEAIADETLPADALPTAPATHKPHGEDLPSELPAEDATEQS